jgi:hypothetical protein
MQEILLKQLIEYFVQPTEKEWQHLKDVLTEIKFEKNQLLLKIGRQNAPLFFLTDGILRHYF